MWNKLSTTKKEGDPDIIQFVQIGRGYVRYPMNTCQWTVVTGTGRAGTSFIMEVFTKLGLPTGYFNADIERTKHNKCHAGLEKAVDLQKMRSASQSGIQIFKSPFLVLKHNLDTWVNETQVRHVIVPIRSLDDVAESRSKQQKGCGGFWNGASNKEEQWKADAALLSNLFETLSAYSIPTTRLEFPDIISNASYVYKQLKPILSCYNVSKNAFTRAHAQTRNLSLVHHRPK